MNIKSCTGFVATAGLRSIILAILIFGCSRMETVFESDAYLTPIPAATFDAFEHGRPVTTRLQAVIAAQYALQLTRLDWVGTPELIFLEPMKFEEAKRRIGGDEKDTYDKPERLNTQVWMAVFHGEMTITPPMGTTKPFGNRCAHAVIQAQDGMMMQAGGQPCENYDLQK